MGGVWQAKNTQTNKNQMHCNKGSVTSPVFSTAYRRSACVMATKACAHETFEAKTKKSVPLSREKDAYSLMNLLESGDLYPKECQEKRGVDKEFW